MKTKLFTLICLLAISLCSNTACASGKLLPKLKKQPGLTSVYIGKALLNMAGDSADMNIPGINVKGVSNNLESLEIITAETESAANYLRPLAVEAIDKLANKELAMENEEDDTSTQIYIVPSVDGTYFTRLIILVSDTDEYTVIDMQGTLPMDVLNSINF